MTLNFALYYITIFTALSGLGIIFLNSEAILAVCFFIFFALIVQHSGPISGMLEEHKQSVRAELVCCMIDGEKQSIQSKQLLCYKKAQLLTCLEHVTLY